MFVGEYFKFYAMYTDVQIAKLLDLLFRLNETFLFFENFHMSLDIVENIKKPNLKKTGYISLKQKRIRK